MSLFEFYAAAALVNTILMFYYDHQVKKDLIKDGYIVNEQKKKEEKEKKTLKDKLKTVGQFLFLTLTPGINFLIAGTLIFKSDVLLDNARKSYIEKGYYIKDKDETTGKNKPVKERSYIEEPKTIISSTAKSKDMTVMDEINELKKLRKQILNTTPDKTEIDIPKQKKRVK